MPKSTVPPIAPAPSATNCPIKAAVAGLAPRLRQRRKAARPQELLEAALTLFVEKGLAATRTDDVARLAGVSKGTLYLYYPSKDALFKAVVHHYLVQVIAEGTDLLDQFEGSAADLLRLLMQTWWTRVGAEKVAGLVPLIMAESAHFPELAQFYVDQVIEPSRRLLGRAVQRGIDRGEFRGVDVHMAVLALMAPVHFLIMHQHSLAPCASMLTGIDPQAYLEIQLTLLIDGLSARVQRGGEETSPSEA